MNNKIKIAIVGVGNCCMSLVMGLEYYKNVIDDNKNIPGLMNPLLGGYKISDIQITACFDVDRRKVGKDLSKAIFSEPNCTKKFCDVQYQNVTVMKSPTLDGVSDHMRSYFQVDNNQKELSKDEIVSILKDTETQMIISYLPVGSQKATELWAQIALDSNCGFINCIPIFIASNPTWIQRFEEANIPIIGDDVKSQIGATIVNRVLVQMLIDRGAIIDNSWQLNVGGNSDFENMTSQNRLESKKISKTESISCLIPHNSNNTKPYVYAGPNGFIECLRDSKQAYTRIDFRIFGNIPCSIDVKLSVEDSPNSGGVIIDAIRIMKIALDRGIGGPILSASSYYMKHPSQQYDDDTAHKLVEEFINQN